MFARVFSLVVAALAASPALASPAKEAPRVVELKVTAEGFEPASVAVKRGEPLELRVTRTVERTCATWIVIPAEKLKAELPLNKMVAVSFTPKKAGQLRYGCGMGQMVGGVLVVQ